MISKENCRQIIFQNRKIFSDIISRSEDCVDVEKEIDWHIHNAGSRWSLELEDLYCQNSYEEDYDEIKDLFGNCLKDLWKNGIIY